MAEATGRTLQELLPELTAVRCECCGRSEVDEVALVVICEGVMSFRDALVERVARDREAWAEAERATAQALAAAGGGPGG